MSWPIISDNPHIQRHYEICRSSGTGHGLAEMFAFQRAPGCRTDATFLEGECNGSQFEKMPMLGDFYKKEAEAAGVATKGKIYKSGLARFPGDPEAWVNDRHDVQKLVERRGWSCEGSVNVRPYGSVEPEPDVEVADDIVAQRAMDIMDAEPGIEISSTPGELFHKAKESLKRS